MICAAMTVTGPISGEELGITLVHEHLLVDINCWARKPDRGLTESIYSEKVSIKNREMLTRNPDSIVDNCLLLDPNLTIKELMEFIDLGGKTITDVTCRGMGRNPAALAEISKTTGINIIMGSGYYVHLSHPEYLNTMTVEEIRDEIVRDLVEGVGGTGIKAGVIGEIGIMDLKIENEVKVLKGAAQAQKETGACFYIHPPIWSKECLAILNIVEKEGTDLTKTIFCHQSVSWDDFEYQKELCKRGVYLGYDLFGQEFQFDTIKQRFPSDIESLRGIFSLAHAGFLKQMLISQDTCWKIQLKQFGGQGYAHILKNILPQMQKMGLSPLEIDLLLIENPRRVLCGALRT